jgi:hypothetical protein
VSFATPWQVRYVRWWYERQVAWHREMAKRGRDREYNLAAAERDAATIPRIRAHWITTGQLPLVVVTQREALARMRVPPRLSMLQNYDRWVRSPSVYSLPARIGAIRRQRRTAWMFRRSGPRSTKWDGAATLYR